MYRGFAHTRYSHSVVVLVLALGILTTVAAGPAMAQGSASGMRAQYLSDFETMQTKFKELAGAMDADSYGWQPMDGVRTVSEVFMLIVAENYVVPPPGVPRRQTGSHPASGCSRSSRPT